MVAACRLPTGLGRRQTADGEYIAYANCHLDYMRVADGRR